MSLNSLILIFSLLKIDSVFQRLIKTKVENLRKDTDITKKFHNFKMPTIEETINTLKDMGFPEASSISHSCNGLKKNFLSLGKGQKGIE